MALSVVLAEELTCPIDLELFVQPMVLKCQHVLCEKDIVQMIDKDGLVQCPTCKRVSEEKDIKKDFKTQRLLELHAAHKDRFQGQQICDVCDERVASSKCKECQLFFYETCQKGHHKIPLTKTHTFVTLNDIERGNKNKLEDTLAQMGQQMKAYDHLQSLLESNTEMKDQKYSEAESKLNNMERELLDEVRKEFTRLRNMVKEKASCQIYLSKQDLEKLTDAKDSFKRDEQLLKDILSQGDTKTLINDELIVQLIAQFRESAVLLDKQVKAIKIPNMEFVISLPSPTNVTQELKALQIRQIKQSDPDLRAVVEIEEQTPPPLPKRGGEELKKNIMLPHNTTSSLTKDEYLASKLYEYKNNPHRVEFMNNNIWTCAYSRGSIEVLTYNERKGVRFQKEIWIHEEKQTKPFLRKAITQQRNYWATSVKSTNFGIVAALSGVRLENKALPYKDLGLVNVNGDGLIQTVISYSKYRDLAADKRRIYGVLHSDKKITIHENQPKGWEFVTEVQLENDYFRIAIFQQTLILSSASLYSVKKYQLNTKASKEYRLLNKTCDWWPRVIDCDNDGNVLICDEKNNQLVALMHDNTWQILHVQGLDKPLDATFDASGDLLVVSFNNKSLVRLQLKN